MHEDKQSNRYERSLTEDGRYRLLVEGIREYAIYMLDRNGKVTSWNPGAARFTGYKPGEIIGQHFSRFYVEEDRQAGAPETALAVATQEGAFEGEGWRVRKDGSRFWAHVVIDPIITNAGALVGFAKITRDLTERRQSQADIRRSEEQFRLLVQSVIDYAIYMLDPGGRITSWNQGAERLKGYSAEEIIGQHYSRFYTEEERAQGIPDRNLQIAAAEGRFEKEGWRVRKDGTRFWANVVIDPIRAEHGTREALFQSQKTEAIGRLTGGVAHDFNNLLMAILGSLEIARKRMKFDPKISPLIDNAIQAGQRGAGLTQRMLVFARREKLHPQPVDLLSLVRGMRDMFQRSLGTEVRIEIRFPLSLPLVSVDPVQLETALVMDSKIGAGTTVQLWLPVASEATEEAPAHVETESAAASAPPLVVLAVDDDPLVLLNTKMILEDLGHAAVTANSGAEALEVLTRIAQVNVVITDQAMPNMTGLQLASLIQEGWPGLPIIIATGYAEMPNGSSIFPKIGKPYSQSDIEKAIAQAVRARQ